MFARPRSQARRMPPRSSSRATPDSKRGAIVMDSAPRGMIAVPAQNSVDPSLRHARLPWSVRQALQRVAGVIAFVGDQLRRCLWRGCRIKRGQLLHRGFERDRQADSVAPVGCVQFGRDDRTVSRSNTCSGL